MDPLIKGQCIKHLFIKDTVLVSKVTLLYKLYIKKPSIMDKAHEFILFGGSGPLYTYVLWIIGNRVLT